MRAVRDPRLPRIEYDPKRFTIGPDETRVGIDLEWDVDSGRPYLASAASKHCVVSAPWRSMTSLLRSLCLDERYEIVGHNVSQADVPILEEHLNIEIPLRRQQDTLLRYYLTAQYLAGTDAAVDGEGGFTVRRGAGRLRLGSLVSAHTLLAAYKECRGPWCAGPCPIHQEREYNALDAWAVLEALDELLELQRSKGIPEALYEHLLRLNACCERFPPIPVDLDAAAEISERLEAARDALFPSRIVAVGKRGQPLKKPRVEFETPFNPRSPKAIKDFFNPRLKRPLLKTEEEYLQRRTPPVDAEAAAWWTRLLEYKSLGKGLTAWLSPEYLHDVDSKARRAVLRPRWIAYGSSSGRVATASPNVQNFPKNGMMAEMRRAIVAPLGYKQVAMDAGQLELRVMLLRGGAPLALAGRDAFTWLLSLTREELEAVAAAIRELDPNAYLGNPRNIVKRMVHAANYGEGLQLVSDKEAATQRWRNRHNPEILEGSYELHRDWRFQNYMIAFTGVNLATALYGNSSRESRIKALGLQRVLHERMPALRNAQREILAFVDREGRARSSSGRCLDLPMLKADPTQAAKLALAHEGQGFGADYMQCVLLDVFERSRHEDFQAPILFVHDEIVVPVPQSWDDAACLALADSLEKPYELTGPDMWAPFSCKVGPNYKEMRKLR